MPNENDNSPAPPIAPPHPGPDPEAPPAAPEQAAAAPAPAADAAPPAPEAPKPDPKQDDPAQVDPNAPPPTAAPSPAPNDKPPADPTHPLASKMLQIIADANMMAPVVVGILVLAMIFYGRPLVQFMIDPPAARALIGMAICLSTIGLAFVLVFQAFRTTDPQQFQRGREIYGGLIGIFGTIIGFYFGTTGSSTASLDIDRLTVTGQAVTFHVKGGQPPYTATLIAKGNLADTAKTPLDKSDMVTVDLNGNANYVLSDKVANLSVTVDVQDSANHALSKTAKYPADEAAKPAPGATPVPASSGASATASSPVP